VSKRSSNPDLKVLLPWRKNSTVPLECVAIRTGIDIVMITEV